MAIHYVKANEELFNAWKSLAYRLEQNNAIVQNDQPISDEELLVWAQNLSRTLKEIELLKAKTQQYILLSSPGDPKALAEDLD